MLSIQETRWSRLVQRLFALPGFFGMTAIDDVLPTLDIQSQLPELRHLRQEYLFASPATGTAAVGNFARGIIATADTAHIIVCTHVEVFSAAAGLATVGIRARATAGMSQATGPLDARIGNPVTGNVPFVLITGGNEGAAFPAGSIQHGNVAAGAYTLVQLAQPAVLTSETELWAAFNVANTAANFMFYGYTRAATETERIQGY